MDQMKPLTVKILELENGIHDLMKLHPKDFIQDEKARLENMKPLISVLNIKNFEDELVALEAENKGKWTKENLDKMQTKINNLLTDANDIYLSTPNSNPYKKNLRDAIDRLEAKKSLLQSEDQNLEMLAREEKAKKDAKLRFADFKEIPIIEEGRTIPIEYGKVIPEDMINKEKELENKQKENQENLENKIVPTDIKKTSVDQKKNVIIPTSENQSNDRQKPIVYTNPNIKKTPVPSLTYELIPADNENKKLLEQIIYDENTTKETFKEKYNRDVNMEGTANMCKIIVRNMGIS